MRLFLFRTCMQFLAWWPLPLLRALGWLLGSLLYYVGKRRVHIANTNLRLCFPHWTAAQRARLVRQHVRQFAQAALDRSWLYHRSRHCLQKRLRLSGDIAVFDSDAPLVVFNPHFLGMEAAGLCLQARFSTRKMVTIYTPLRGATLDAWALAGRTRFGGRAFSRYANVRHVVRALRAGERVLLLPDMDFGVNDSVFAPFFGMPAATLTALGRYADLGPAQVVTLSARLDRKGYQVHLDASAWQHFPTGDAHADATHMNAVLERLIQTMPSEYYWLHRRFKTRPAGAPAVY